VGPAKATIVLAHGAGAPMDTPFMDAIAARCAALGHRVIRFEFAYMSQRRIDAKRRPPQRADALLTRWCEVVAALAGTTWLMIGGKSMGGCMASMLAAEQATALGVAGVVCLGYPFHPAGRPEKVCTAHQENIAVATLIVQGERDALGNRTDVAGYALGDGYHSFVAHKKSGHTLEANLDNAAAASNRFVAGMAGAGKPHR
jgi:predicted alpha/beta-hydrolase family hydrolase